MDDYPLPRLETTGPDAQEDDEFPPVDESFRSAPGLDHGAGSTLSALGPTASALSLPIPTAPEHTRRRERRLSVASHSSQKLMRRLSNASSTGEPEGRMHRVMSFMSYHSGHSNPLTDATSNSSIPSDIENELRETFQQIDADNTGTLDKQEIYDMLIRLGEDPTEGDLDELIELIDENGDGELTFDEFKQIYRQLDGGGGVFKRINLDKLLGAPSFLDDAEVSAETHERHYRSIPILERLGATYLKFLLWIREKNAARRRERDKNANIPAVDSTSSLSQNKKSPHKTPKKPRSLPMLSAVVPNGSPGSWKESPSLNSMKTTSPPALNTLWPPIAPLPEALPGVLCEADWPPPVVMENNIQPDSEAIRNSMEQSDLPSPTSKAMKQQQQGFTEFMDTSHRRQEFTRHDVGGHVYHTITRPTLKRIRRIEAWTIFRAVLYGALSAVAAGLFENLANSWWPDVGGLPWTGTAPMDEDIWYWSVVMGTMCLFTFIEILALYADALSSALKAAELAGLKLYPLDEGRAFITRALSRTALEINHPCYQLYGIDPLRHHSTTKRFLIMLAYKAKSGISVFMFRLLIRRVLGRALAKTALPFMAAPIIMLWNGLVSWKVMQGARLLVLGPPTLLLLCDALLVGTSLTYFMRRQIFRTIGVALVKNAEVHPNLEVMLRHLHARLGLMRPREDLDDFMLFIHDMVMCSREEQLLIMKFLLLAFMADGTINARDRRYLRKTMSASGLKTGLSRLKLFAKDFVDGRVDTVTIERLESLFADGGVEMDNTDEDEEKNYLRKAWRGIIWLFTV